MLLFMQSGSASGFQELTGFLANLLMYIPGPSYSTAHWPCHFFTALQSLIMASVQEITK
jgi:hypothetical protein